MNDSVLLDITLPTGTGFVKVPTVRVVVTDEWLYVGDQPVHWRSPMAISHSTTVNKGQGKPSSTINKYMLSDGERSVEFRAFWIQRRETQQHQDHYDQFVGFNRRYVEPLIATRLADHIAGGGTAQLGSFLVDREHADQGIGRRQDPIRWADVSELTSRNGQLVLKYRNEKGKNKQRLCSFGEPNVVVYPALLAALRERGLLG